MKPTKSNISGVESFDHAAIADLLEYQAAYKALDDLVHAINKTDIGLGQRRWLKTVEQMAASLSYADSTGHDEVRHADCPAADQTVWPFQATVKGRWLHGEYRCPVCGDDWTCGYAVNIADLL